MTGSKAATRSDRTSTNASASMIMIVGVARRSGTNFLARLLGAHPDCGAPGDPVREDHLLRHVGDLDRYVRRTARHWPRRWGDRELAAGRLRRHLGVGLTAFLQDQSDAPVVVTKTPSPAGVERFWSLFPDGRLVVLVRDGRSVVESQVHGFGFTRERAMLDWRRGARRLVRLREHPGDEPIVVVTYEALVRDVEVVLTSLLVAVGLSAEDYDFTTAHALPVAGSSFLRGDGDGIDWRPVERPTGFDPTERSGTWRRWQRERFAWVAGPEQRALGYPVDASGGPVWVVMNLVLDLCRPAVLLLDVARTGLRQLRKWHEAPARRSRSWPRP